MADNKNSVIEQAAPVSGALPLLEVSGLAKYFPVGQRGLLGRSGQVLKAVDGIDFTLAEGQSLGLVGESGCGKSTTGRLITRLYEPSVGRISFRGQDISHASRSALAPIRHEIQMVFQDPYSSLNPRRTVGTIVRGPLDVRADLPREARRERVRELLDLVGLNPEHYNRYPHEFSGGQRQRVGVARALAAEPSLIVADEPVSALDVSIQAQIVNLLRKLQDELGLAFVFIAHDLAVVRHFAQRVAVMYLGRIAEIGDREQVYQDPRHPYTQALLSAVPDPDPRRERERELTRVRLTGEVPSPVNPPSGCAFRTRCPKAREQCALERPEPLQISGSAPDHLAACHFPDPLPA